MCNFLTTIAVLCLLAGLLCLGYGTLTLNQRGGVLLLIGLVTLLFAGFVASMAVNCRSIDKMQARHRELINKIQEYRK